VPSSRRIFAALLKLLLERGELGKGRIRIGLSVAAAGIAKRLGVVTLAFGTIDTFPALASWAVAPRTAVMTFSALALFLQALLTLVTILALLAVGSRAVLAARTAGAARRRGRFGRRRCGHLAFRRRYRCPIGRSNVRLLLTMRPARAMWAALRAARRAPHFDERWLLGGLRFVWCTFNRRCRFCRSGFSRGRFLNCILRRLLHRRRCFRRNELGLGQ
jgi:hypothetical protein